MPNSGHTFLPSGTETPLAPVAHDYLDLLLSARRREAENLVLKTVDSGADIRDIYLHVFQPVQYEVGRLWQINKVSVAQEHFCTAATQMVMARLFPQILSTPRSGNSLVACCVGGELHELGIRMVSDFFEMDGWNTYYLGASTPDADVAHAIHQNGANLLCISVTMPFNVHLAAKLIRTVRDNAQNTPVKILTGGFPFNANPNLYAEIGADAMATNALEAVRIGTELVTPETATA